MNDLLKNIKNHKWEIVHFAYNVSLYMDNLFLCDLMTEDEVSGPIRDVATHVYRDMIDLPENYFK